MMSTNIIQQYFNSLEEFEDFRLRRISSMDNQNKIAERELKEKKIAMFGSLDKYKEFAKEWNMLCGKINQGKNGRRL